MTSEHVSLVASLCENTPAVTGVVSELFQKRFDGGKKEIQSFRVVAGNRSFREGVRDVRPVSRSANDVQQAKAQEFLKLRERDGRKCGGEEDKLDVELAEIDVIMMCASSKTRQASKPASTSA